MAMTTAQSQLTPTAPLASLQFLRPYTKDQAAALNPDESAGLLSLEALGKQYPDSMWGVGQPADMAQAMFTPQYLNEVGSGYHGLPAWAPPHVLDRINTVMGGGGAVNSGQ
jgi:hypothetical protein